ncbi:hypothetical protein GJ496_006232 [Pomphorhynchus laevis]|nr:hypothetical protein GJ496_006232 [Pomphorhynchus laevis]
MKSPMFLRHYSRVAKRLTINQDLALPGERFEPGSEQFSLQLFSSKSKRFIDDMHLHSSGEFDFRVSTLRRKLINYIQQRRTNELNSITSTLQLQLGFDLYAIKKTLELGGRVKLKDSIRWFSSKESSLAHSRTKGLSLEGVDLSFTQINRMGLNIYAGCDNLRFFSFRNCVFVDSWFVSRFTYLFNERVHFLDLSQCPKIDSTCITPLFRLKLYDLPNLKGHELMLLELNDELPNCLIEGFDYFMSDDDLSKETNSAKEYFQNVTSDIASNDKEFLEKYVILHPDQKKLQLNEELKITRKLAEIVRADLRLRRIDTDLLRPPLLKTTEGQLQFL